jgi:hypothetical protein
VRRSGDDADAHAVALLRVARDEALSSRDLPVIGTLAAGGAELAAYRGEAGAARELSALAIRIGAHDRTFFPPGDGERLNAALGNEEQREPSLAVWRQRSVAAATARIRELMDDLLA